jgi:hypothetical protein
MRAATSRALALLLGVAALLSSVRPCAGDDVPAARLKSGWTTAKDAERLALLDAVTAAPDAAGLAAVVDAARASLETVLETKRLTRRVEELAKDLVDAEGKPKGLGKADLADLADLARTAERETRSLDVLARAAGKVLDGLPEAAFPEAAESVVRAGTDPTYPGIRDWAGAALGATRLPRTPPFVLAVAAEGLAEHRKVAAARAGPAKKLDEVNAKIAEILLPLLRKQQEKGDYSGQLPNAQVAGLLGTLPQRRAELEKEVRKHTDRMDVLDARRAVARTALGRSIDGLEGDARERQLDAVEKTLLKSTDPDVRAFGIGVLGPVRGPRALALLVAAAAEADARHVVAALEAMGGREEPGLVELLAAPLRDPRWQVRAAAAAALARTGRGAAVPPLVEALGAATGRTLDDLREALASLTAKGFPAAQAPWKAWWEKEGAGFRGPRDPRPEGEPPPAVAGGPSVTGEEGGTTFYGITTHSERVLFVLDFSGSMNFPATEGDAAKKKVDVLREEFRRATTGLPDGATLGVVGFSVDVRLWRKEPAKRDAKSAADAVQWVDRQEVVGGTNIYDALEKAFQLATPKDPKGEPVFDTMYFMTDGTPTAGKVTNAEQIRADVRRWNLSKRVRLHVVGMGGHQKPKPGDRRPPQSDLDERFLRLLAEDNGGQCVIR